MMEEQEFTKLLAQFLRQYSAFGGELTVDRVGLAPGSVGLFPGGRSEKLLRRSILNRCLYRSTWQFVLRYRAVSGEDAARRLEQFALWAQDRSDRGLCPVFGGDTRITTGKISLADPRADGCGLYEIGLTVTATVGR